MNSAISRAPDASLDELAVHGRLFELYDQMLGEVDIVNVLHHTADAVSRSLNAERATIYLVVRETQELESAAIVGNISRTIRLPICEQSLAGFCALTGRSFVIPDAYDDLSHIDPRLKLNRSWDEMTGFRTRDVMCAPALFKGELMGVVQAMNSNNGPFQKSHLDSLQSVSRYVAYALYHARLYNELATLKTLEKQKAEFMKIIVHELKSPVAASKSLASGLLYATKDDPRLAPVLTRIESRMDQLLNLVQDILDLSRIKSGCPLGDVAVCDLAAETIITGEGYREQAQARGLSLRIEVPETPTPVRIDLQGYHLIVSNLVSNAVKYTPAGSVTVILQQQGTWAVLEVSDTGMGIPKDDISRLFNEFFRASNARRSKIQGTGVGLAGVKALVERFGGEMELQSQENKGTVFIVRLPLHKNEES